MFWLNSNWTIDSTMLKSTQPEMKSTYGWVCVAWRRAVWRLQPGLPSEPHCSVLVCSRWRRCTASWSSSTSACTGPWWPRKPSCPRWGRSLSTSGVRWVFPSGRSQPCHPAGCLSVHPASAAHSPSVEFIVSSVKGIETYREQKNEHPRTQHPDVMHIHLNHTGFSLGERDGMYKVTLHVLSKPLRDESCLPPPHRYQ